MKRSGLPVIAASRVIEIEEVFEPTIGSGLSCGLRLSEDPALYGLVLGRGLDDDVAIAHRVEVGRRRDALRRPCARHP